MVRLVLTHEQHSLYTQFWGNKMRNHVLYLTPLIALEMWDKERATIDTIFCLPSICVLDPENSKNINYSPRGCGKIYIDAMQRIKALKVHFLVKLPKMPLVNPKLTETQMRPKSSQNNIFHAFTLNPSHSKIFVNFGQRWPSLTLSWPLRAPKTLIFYLSIGPGWG